MNMDTPSRPNRISPRPTPPPMPEPPGTPMTDDQKAEWIRYSRAVTDAHRSPDDAPCTVVGCDEPAPGTEWCDGHHRQAADAWREQREARGQWPPVDPGPGKVDTIEELAGRITAAYKARESS